MKTKTYKEHQKIYMKEYRQRPGVKEKQKRTWKEYCLKNKEKLKEYHKEYYKKYYQNNKEKLKEYMKKYHKEFGKERRKSHSKT